MSCSKEEKQTINFDALKTIIIPQGFPELPFPEDNVFTPDRWKLGKMLFYDNRLSSDNTISCASCHQQQFAFSDNQALSSGAKGRAGTRNAPTLANIAYHPYFTREGGVPTLEMQVLVPVQEHNEFDFNIVDIASKLKSDNTYQELALKAYGRNLDPYVITRAISNFERSILSGNSRYDAYIHGDKNSLTEEELTGRDLFFSDKTKCSHCHNGINFTNYQFNNNGIYSMYSDAGRNRLTGKEEDIGVFKTASLRNLGYTAPYMHNGSMPDLETVIEHYDSGGQPHINKSPLIAPLHLTSKEKRALKAFLMTLNDTSVINNKYYSN